MTEQSVVTFGFQEPLLQVEDRGDLMRNYAVATFLNLAFVTDCPLAANYLFNQVSHSTYLCCLTINFSLFRAV